MSKCRRLEGKVALITAATAGIGLGIALRLGQEGAKVVICSRKQQNVDDAVQLLRSHGIEAAGIACHVGEQQQRERLIQFTIDTYSQLDILVSNAAANPAAGPLLSLPESAIDKVLDINIKSAILIAKEAVPHMPQPGGAIVFVSSYTGFNPAAAPISMYAITKTAVLAIVKALAEELGPDGIRVNGIAPGVVPTKFAAALTATPETERAAVQRTMLGRLGTPADMAAAVAYLVSEDASYVTGETLLITGGMQSRM